MERDKPSVCHNTRLSCACKERFLTRIAAVYNQHLAKASREQGKAFSVTLCSSFNEEMSG